MILGSRKSKIISQLINSDNYITGQYLASVLGVTSRTIRDDIAKINSAILDKGIEINSVAGQGYYISKEDKKKLVKIVNIQPDYMVPVLPDARIEHIIKQLILNPKGIDVTAMSQQVYVSKSTLNRDLIKVKQKLEEHNISLVKSSSNVIRVDGDEVLIRQMYNSFVAKWIKAHCLDKSILNDKISIIFDKVSEIIQSISDNETELTGDEFDAAVLFITVVVFRNKYGFKLSLYNNKKNIDKKMLNYVVELVNDYIDINEWEKLYIKEHLSNIIFSKVTIEDKDNIKNIVKKGINSVSNTFNYAFDEQIDDKLKDILLVQHIKSSEYSFDDINKEYPLAVEMAVSLLNYIKDKIEIEINENMLVKIVLLFVCEMEKNLLEKELKKRKVVIVCQSGELIKSLIESRLKRHFPGFNILGFFPLYKMNDAIKLKPELIISTVMTASENCPVVVINPLFKDYDVLKVNTAIRQIEHTESVSYEFLNLFKENLFVKDIETSDRYEVIRILSDALMQTGYSGEGFYQDVIERENISPTAIGNMTAVPHALGSDLGENVAAIGILKKPIDWKNEKVQLVFLINIKNTSDGNVKQIFNSFFDLISSGSKVERIIKSKNYYEFLKNINQ